MKTRLWPFACQFLAGSLFIGLATEVSSQEGVAERSGAVVGGTTESAQVPNADPVAQADRAPSEGDIEVRLSKLEREIAALRSKTARAAGNSPIIHPFDTPVPNNTSTGAPEKPSAQKRPEPVAHPPAPTKIATEYVLPDGSHVTVVKPFDPAGRSTRRYLLSGSQADRLAAMLNDASPDFNAVVAGDRLQITASLKDHAAIGEFALLLRAYAPSK